jgi:hypothetical protein
VYVCPYNLLIMAKPGPSKPKLKRKIVSLSEKEKIIKEVENNPTEKKVEIAK